MCAESPSTDRRARLRPGVALQAFLAATLAGLSGAGTTLAAGNVKFAPEAEVRVYRTGNTALVGNGESDTVAHVLVRLALLGEGPTSRYRLAYTPYRDMYSNADDLDNTGHLLSASWDLELPRRSTFSLTADASRSQLQGIQAENPGQPTTFIPRTTLDRFTLRLGGRVGTGHRSFVSWESGGDLVRHREPPCINTQTCISFEDSRSVLAGLTWGYEVSRGATLGVRYGYQDISFDTREGIGTHTLQLHASRRFGEHTTGELQVGASRSATADLTRTDPSVNATLRRVLTDRMSFAFGVREAISSGSGLTPATLDRGGYASWEFTSATGRYSAGISAGDWQRKSVLEAEPAETETLSTAEDLAFRVGRNFKLGLFHSYSRQSASGTVAALAASYHSGGVFVRWVFRPRVHPPETEGARADPRARDLRAP